MPAYALPWRGRMCTFLGSEFPSAEESWHRIDAMKVFVAVLDEGGLAGAGRKLRRSPAAIRSRGQTY
jgi:hypothetical protein